MASIKDISNTSTYRQFQVTRRVQCKFGVHRDFNAGEICRWLGYTMLNVHFGPGNVAYLTLSCSGVPTRVEIGDYIVKHLDGTLEIIKAD